MNGTSYNRSYFVSSCLNSRVLRPSHAAFTVNHLFSLWSSVPGQTSPSIGIWEASRMHLSKRAERSRENSHAHGHTSLAGVTKQWSCGVSPDVYGLHRQSLLKQQYIDFKQSLLNKRWGHFSRCTYQLSLRNQIQFSSVLLPAMDPSLEGRSYTQICSSISGEIPPLPSTGDAII